MLKNPPRPRAHLRGVFLVSLLIGLWVVLSLQRDTLPGLHAQAAATDKNGRRVGATQPVLSPSSATPRAPAGHKNDGQTPTASPTAVTADLPDGVMPATTTALGQLLTCGASGDSTWTTTNASLQVIRSCGLSAPEQGVLLILASASLGLGSDLNPYEAHFALDIDATSGNPATDRWVNVATDTGDGTDKSIANTLLTPVGPGAHTINFLGARYAGSGAVQVYDSTLSVLYIPQSQAHLHTCGVAGNTSWTTTEATFQPIRSCILTAPSKGMALLVASGSLGLSSDLLPYEGRFRLGVDTVDGASSTDRWVNIYPDGSDGSDETLAVSLLTPVTAGAHTFYLSGQRQAGSGAVQLYDPTLSVLFIPPTSLFTPTCAANGDDVWTNDTTSHRTIRQCSLTMPEDGVVLILADAAAGLNEVGANHEWEGRFLLGVDNEQGSSITERWINVYNDASPGNGTDRTLAASWLTDMSAGTHTVYWVGQRYAGLGTLRLSAPSLSVVALYQPAPTPRDDQATTVSNQSVTLDVLANDSDPEGEALTLIAVATPSHGAAVYTPSGLITYTSMLTFTGIDVFTYTVSDGRKSASATVTITVNPPNTPPLAVADAYTVTAGSVLSVAAPGVLANDSDADGDPLAVTLNTAVQHGVLALAADGSFVYTPVAGFSGVDTFTYQVSDGATTSNLVTVTLKVRPAPNFTLTKTIGIQTIQPECTQTGNSRVPIKTTVVYCYTLTNTGNVTLTNHTLIDNKLGTILSNARQVVTPGASFSVTVTATLTISTTNVATWTATTGPGAAPPSVGDPAAAIRTQTATVILSSPTDDQDGDTIPDNGEGAGDPDGDNVPNFLDPDADGDSRVDEVEAGPDPTHPLDSNNDGLPDFLDPTPVALRSFLPLIRR